MPVPDERKDALHAPADEQRRHARFPVSLPVSFGDGVSVGTGTVVDISREGCRIRCEDGALRVKYFQAEIWLGEPQETLLVGLAVMRWSRENECGVEFIRMEPSQQARLQRMIHACEEACAEPAHDGDAQGRPLAAIYEERSED